MGRFDIRNVVLEYMWDEYTVGFYLTHSGWEKIANLIKYRYNSFPRVTRSVIAAEKHDLVLGFDLAFLTGVLLAEVIGWELSVEVLDDIQQT